MVILRKILNVQFQKFRTNKHFMPLLIVMIAFAACQSTDKSNAALTILDVHQYSEMPGGSGILKINGLYYTVGDNSPYLFALDSQFTVRSKTAIADTNTLKNHTIPKDQKIDFEAITKINTTEIVIFGSGSKSPRRDVFVRVFLKDSIQYDSYSLVDFYTQLKALSCMKNTELNIEGAAFWQGKLSLFNRTNNVIFTVEYTDFLAYLNRKKASPTIDITHVDLPKINGMRSGFSGAEVLAHENQIVFTSSVEAADNAYNDGEILGSFIGFLDISSGNIKATKDIFRIPEYKTPLKVESVAYLKKVDHKTSNYVLIVDNDDDKSLIILVSMAYK